MKILVVGSGGREHALVWRLAQSKRVEHVYVAPGNGGTAAGFKNVSNVPIDVGDFARLVEFAVGNSIDLVLPGPEAPLVDGIEAWFRKVGIPVFGPSQAAARMEGSKTFSKDFMQRHSIPTAAYANFTSYEPARAYLDTLPHRVVLKASGLAAGKGVLIPADKDAAHAGLREIMVDREFGDAGDEVVIEEFLEGDELSILAFSDGYTVIPLPPAQDHKRALDGDLGPNTGGMGCYAPTRIASAEVLAEIKRTILQPTIDGMRREGFPFRGMLFTGLMMTKQGPKVLEYNVRFGDPETQTVLPLLSEGTDLAEVLSACAGGWLDAVEIGVTGRFAATVVVAAGGYPAAYEKGREITVGAVGAETVVFHAGTALVDGKVVSAGGRVIAATATADTLEEAVARAYAGVGSISFEGMFYRRDIAHRAFSSSAPSASSAAAPAPLTYASAGVSITAGNDLVTRIKSAVRSTRIPGTSSEIGGFGGLFDLRAAGYTDPLLVAGIDGVGTKLKLASALNKHSTVGIDLVAMSVNDLLAQGATPLFFLDYYATGHLDVDAAALFVEGVAEGCRRAGCALIGGETAEMPGMYNGGDYDAAGCAVGAVDRARVLPRTADMVPGDVLIGLASDGVHSNGFSLIRRIVARAGLAWTDPVPWDTSSSQSIGEAFLTPTRIYVRPLLKAADRGLLKGMAHITGGGLTENIPRMLPGHLEARVDVGSWALGPMYRWLMRQGGVERAEMARTWNVGLGFVVAVAGADVEEVLRVLRGEGETAVVVGTVQRREGGGEGCVLSGLESWGEA